MHNGGQGAHAAAGREGGAASPQGTDGNDIDSEVEFVGASKAGAAVDNMPQREQERDGRGPLAVSAAATTAASRLHDARRRSPQVVLVLCGVVGSGKSTFAQALETQLPECFVRCNQDALGSRRAVETAVRRALASGKSPVIDRVNGDAGQRATWVDLAAATTGAAAAAAAVEVWALEFATPMATCRARLVERTGHETLRSTEQALDVLARFSRGYAPPRASEGFHRIAQVRPADMPCVPPSAADIEAILARLAAAPALVPTTQVSYPSPSRRPAHSHRGGAQRPWRPARPTGRGPGYAYGRGGGGGYLPQLVRAYESPYAPGHSGYSGQPQGLSPLHSSSIGPPPYGAHRPAAAAAAHPHPPFYGHDSNDSSSGRPPRSNAHPENSQDGRW